MASAANDHPPEASEPIATHTLLGVTAHGHFRTGLLASLGDCVRSVRTKCSEPIISAACGSRRAHPPGVCSMMNRLIPIAAIAALMFTGCKQTEADTAKDVASAQADATESIDASRADATKTVAEANADVADAQQTYDKSNASAQKKLTAAESAAMIEMAKADYEVATTEATGRN